MKQQIETREAPAAIGPYSQGVAAGEMIFVSGQLPIDPATGAMPAGAADQARQSLTNVEAILAAAGSSMAGVVKTTIFLADMGDFTAVNEVYAAAFPAPYPARACFAVAALPKGAKVEIEAIAVKEK